MTAGTGRCDGITPREVTLRVIGTLLERGRLAARAVPSTPVRPQTLWTGRQVEIYQVYARSGRAHGTKKRVADALGITPAELSRQFRAAEAVLLEAYYVAGVLAPAGTLRDPRAVHRCLSVYDDMTPAPRRLANGQHTDLYWSRPPEQDRLAPGHRTLLRTAARTLAGEDVLYLNAAAAYDTSHDVRVDPTKAADLYWKLTSQCSSSSPVRFPEPVVAPAPQPVVAPVPELVEGSVEGRTRPPSAFRHEFTAALREVETRLGELLTRTGAHLALVPQEVRSR